MVKKLSVEILNYFHCDDSEDKFQDSITHKLILGNAYFKAYFNAYFDDSTIRRFDDDGALRERAFRDVYIIK